MNKFDMPVNFSFICPDCNKEISHNYTQDDVFKNEELEFACECGYTQKVATADILKKAENEVVGQLKKIFKTI